MQSGLRPIVYHKLDPVLDLRSEKSTARRWLSARKPDIRDGQRDNVHPSQISSSIYLLRCLVVDVPRVQPTSYVAPVPWSHCFGHEWRDWAIFVFFRQEWG